MDRPTNEDDERDSCDRPFTTHPSPIPLDGEDDAVNVSRDDSDLGGEYFLRMTPSSWCLSPSDHHGDHQLGYDSYNHFNKPNDSLSQPTFSPHSDVHTDDDEGVVDHDERRERHSQHSTSPPIHCWSTGSNLLYGEAIEGSFNAPSNSQPFFLHPHFRPSRGVHYDFESDESTNENKLLVLSPSDAQFSCHSVDESDDNATHVTPPSVPYPPSLSPPPLTDETKVRLLPLVPQSTKSSHHSIRSQPSRLPRVIRASNSRETLTEHAPSMSRATGTAVPAHQQQPHRPPRAPYVHSRCHASLFHSSSGGSFSSLPNNISCSTSSLHQTPPQPHTINPMPSNHTRAHSSGDTSVLSALTDSDFEGGAFLLEQCGGSAVSDRGAGPAEVASCSRGSQVPWSKTQRAHVVTSDLVWDIPMEIPSFLQQPILTDYTVDLHDTDFESVGPLSSTIGQGAESQCGPYDIISGRNASIVRGTSRDGKERHLDSSETTWLPLDLSFQLNKLQIANVATVAGNTVPGDRNRKQKCERK